jgi:ATP-dependent Clp protease ATP-binding subunit ClpB
MNNNQQLPPDYDDGSQNPLQKFTHNLTDDARNGKLDPIIGRNEEIRRVMQVLSRRTKNNPVLIGDPGVGKTAIVEGLAQRIVSKDIPETLQNKELLVLDIALVLAGAKYRGEFEDRLKNIIKTVEKDPDKYILFIDELHTLVGAGGEGAMDAANILKPALARGQVRTIGATTIKEYRQYIEKDQALERRFQPVMVGEPSPEDSITILRGIKEKYELHHGIRITDDAIIAAVELSRRYITDRFLPDKAVDLIDEATSALKIETQSMPVDLDTLKRRIIQLEIEQAALKKEKTDTAKDRLTAIGIELISLKERSQEMEKHWNEQKKLIAKIQENKIELDKARAELEKAQREVDLQKAAEIQYGKIPQLEQNLSEAEKEWKKIPESERILREEVTSEDIARVVSRWTGVPVTRLLTNESQKLEHLEADLQRRVVGQDEALHKIANAIRRSRAGLSEENRPIGSFLFLGPTGVGKTETAKALAEYMFNDENALVRIDMSEYSESHSVARLIGAPPGYVGYEEGGQLTEAVRRRPYSVILFDEIEKAHPQIFNVFLQILDDGRLTDGNGRTVDFRNTLIIMTSNLQEDQLKTFFRPEFLNRLDNTVIFNKLSEENIQNIVEIQLENVRKRLEKQQIKVEISTKVRSLLAKLGYDTVYGARPLRRLIESTILDELALQIIEGKKKSGDTVQIDVKNGKISLD